MRSLSFLLLLGAARVGVTSVHAMPAETQARSQDAGLERCEGAVVVTFQGSRGRRGQDGQPGLNGPSGASGSKDLKHPRVGGAGGDGRRGSDGDRGGVGGDGPAVTVAVRLQEDAPTLLRVRVEAEGETKLYLVDPQRASLTVRSVGGPGGWGGRGGRGGRGGEGGLGSPSGRRGLDGQNGRDGGFGPSGHGGVITLRVDPSAKPFLSALKVEAPGGPAPEIVEGPVSF